MRSITITIPSDLQAQLLQRASEEGISVDAYLERLIREDAAWTAHSGALLDEADPDFAEIQGKVAQGLEQAERGQGRPAQEAFTHLRAKHGLSS
jgi:hypothetical protein